MKIGSLLFRLIEYDEFGRGVEGAGLENGWGAGLENGWGGWAGEWLEGFERVGNEGKVALLLVLEELDKIVILKYYRNV